MIRLHKQELEKTNLQNMEQIYQDDFFKVVQKI